MPRCETGSFEIDDTRVAYTVQRSARRRRTIALYVDSGGVRVLAPARTGLAALQALLRERTGWIARRLAWLRLQRPAETARPLIHDDAAFFQGESLPVRVTRDPARPSGCVLDQGTITMNVALPEIAGEALREEVRLELLLWYKRQARRVFRERLDHWEERLGVTYRRVIVASPTRRWGSCNARNDIRLNWRLMLAPPDLLDYVAAHELCHVLHKDHSRRFWDCLNRVMPDCKARRQRLRSWECGAKED